MKESAFRSEIIEAKFLNDSDTLDCVTESLIRADQFDVLCTSLSFGVKTMLPPLKGNNTYLNEQVARRKIQYDQMSKITSFILGDVEDEIDELRSLVMRGEKEGALKSIDRLSRHLFIKGERLSRS